LDGGWRAIIAHAMFSPVRSTSKAAVDGRALAEGRSQPGWIGPAAGRGDAATVGVESKATDGVDWPIPLPYPSVDFDNAGAFEAIKLFVGTWEKFWKR